MPELLDLFGHLFARASQKMQGLISPILQKEGLTPKSMGLLFTLEKNPGITQKKAGEIQQIDRSTMTQQIDFLATLGLVKREPKKTDRRAYGLYLTEKGTDTVRRLWEHVQKAQDIALSKLSDAQISSLKQSLLTIIEE